MDQIMPYLHGAVFLLGNGLFAFIVVWGLWTAHYDLSAAVFLIAVGCQVAARLAQRAWERWAA